MSKQDTIRDEPTKSKHDETYFSDLEESNKPAASKAVSTGQKLSVDVPPTTEVMSPSSSEQDFATVSKAKGGKPWKKQAKVQTVQLKNLFEELSSDKEVDEMKEKSKASSSFQPKEEEEPQLCYPSVMAAEINRLVAEQLKKQQQDQHQQQ